jgi:hypothetical protein
MLYKEDARGAPASYIASARAYAFDLAATLFFYVSISILAGRVWRFPFDNEIATLAKIEPEAARALIASFPATDDIHPPLSYLFFYGLRRLGLSDPGMRLCSLLMTAAALLLCQLLVLRSAIRPRRRRRLEKPAHWRTAWPSDSDCRFLPIAKEQTAEPGEAGVGYSLLAMRTTSLTLAARRLSVLNSSNASLGFMFLCTTAATAAIIACGASD